MTREELAKRWISYTVRIVLGKFKPSVPGAIGRGNFLEEAAERLRALSVPYGIAVLDEGHPHDLAVKIFEVLSIIYGEDQAVEIVHEGTSKRGDPPAVLRKYLSGPFFREHISRIPLLILSKECFMYILPPFFIVLPISIP